MSPTRQDLLNAGYKHWQIVSCPLNGSDERCPCNYGPITQSCGLADDPLLNEACALAATSF